MRCPLACTWRHAPGFIVQTLALGLALALSVPSEARAQATPAAVTAAPVPAAPTTPSVRADVPQPARDPASRLYGYRNAAGAWTITPTFESAGEFDKGLAFVENPGGSGGLVDLTGALVTPNVQPAVWISEPSMTESKVSEELLAARAFGSNKVGFVDLRGRWVIRPQFADAHEFHEGLAAFRTSALGKVGFIDRRGRVVIKPRFGTHFRVPPTFSEGLAAVGLNDLWPRSNLDPPGKLGYIDRHGRWALAPIYAAGTSFKEGRAQVTLNGREIELLAPERSQK